ncbi:FYSH domain-containing protein [Dacryopinax primogenitus]|uniref:FYSH domain-containing protein n=1 Tax=Dacryopinax primogenitus (strain DJM 731) TaxID=1858805 RepID=M5GBK1_DACPD|nr:FYSH domain-containing protein [Dacryopinax primogenitus]EJU06344.1 FYSH domain-containing protein [Dacryopinax primogenitus]
MAKSVSVLVYKPDSQSTDEMIMIVSDPVAYKKWKDGDHTIPLVEVLDSFSVYHSGQGSQGNLGKASKQQLETIFETSNEDAIALIMLEKGTLKASENFGDPSVRFSDRNTSNGARLDTRGHGARGV